MRTWNSDLPLRSPNRANAAAPPPAFRPVGDVVTSPITLTYVDEGVGLRICGSTADADVVPMTWPGTGVGSWELQASGWLARGSWELAGTRGKSHGGACAPEPGRGSWEFVAGAAERWAAAAAELCVQ